MRFVVISSDVVYPVGAMKDYETKFWLPFKGVTKPVYAIPGNHDWYDALEAFAATFLEPGAAHAAMRARVESDLRLTSTTDARIGELVREAGWLRQQYGVPTGFQRAPFFEIQTDRFALIAVDTGVVKRVDPEQMAWLRSALDRARGKSIMAILGHPFYAGGNAQTDGYRGVCGAEAVAPRPRRRDRHGRRHPRSRVLPRAAAAGRTRSHHLVNGGGGAYLSFGTALAWPAKPASPDWAFYPDTTAVMAKIEAETPWWKRPAWWWTATVRRLAGLGRVAVGDVRLQRRAVLSELRRDARRAIGAPYSPATLRHPWPADLG